MFNGAEVELNNKNLSRRAYIMGPTHPSGEAFFSRPSRGLVVCAVPVHFCVRKYRAGYDKYFFCNGHEVFFSMIFFDFGNGYLF